MEAVDKVIKDVRQLVAKNNLKEALATLGEIAKTNGLINVQNEVTVLQQQFEENKRSSRLGKVNPSQINQVNTNISAAILDLLKEFKSEVPAQTKPLEEIEPGIDPPPKRQLFLLLSAFLIAVFLSSLVFYYFYWQPRNNLVCIEKSGLRLYLKEENGAIELVTNPQDFVKCEICHEEYFSLNFDLNDQRETYDSLQIRLRQSFMDEHNWPLEIEEWNKAFPDGYLTYIPIEFSAGRFLFKANFSDD